MSELYVDNIKNRTGGPIGIPTGAVVTGVITATEFIGTAATVGSGTTINSSGVNVSGFVTAAYFVGDGSGLVNVATNSVEGFTVNNNGTLVGIAQTIDFGSDLDVSPAQAGFVTVTTSDNLTPTSVVVDSATTINSSGVNASGIITAAGGFNIGIQSAGTDVATGVVTALNFIGAGNTFEYDSSSKTIDISITGGGSDTTHLIWLTGGG